MARQIVDMISRGEAKNVDDAVKKKPELKQGAEFLSGTLSSDSSSESPVPAATGSGSVRLSR